MNRKPALSPLTETKSEMPDHAGARSDRIAAAISVLETEVARLERLGLDSPLAERRRELRYCQFVQALLGLEPNAERRRAA